ncbi:hybrid sensor histidine kinase/response regulator [Elioraea rosea]|uniref:hybrid sensor histidine kinase/response regulator n=1 Tax=Elioraea rosea TaxID=2492390 RepID=UPI00118282C9|nr:chemotaxis protein CheW [Elioraea rosea]
MDDLLKDFLTETAEAIAELDTALIRLEQSPDDAQTLALIFRLVHTIKGTCGFLGLSRLEKVAHASENVLGKFRDGTMTVTTGAISVVLGSIDRIKTIVHDLEQHGQEVAADDSDIIDALNRIYNGEDVDAPAAVAAAPAEEEELPPEPAATEAPAVEAKAEILPPAGPARDAGRDGTDTLAASKQSIRVGVDVLEDLMTLVSELVLARNQLLQLSRTHENNPFEVPLQRLSHITSDLQDGVMKTRMQPIGNAWSKFPRLVRDIAHEIGKKIDLQMIGAETELDRQVLELIKDPLTHMVRNSVDHGIEKPEDRRAAGKSETGRLVLNAFHEGGHIIIQISDDGRGLNTARIRQKAVAQGLAGEAEVAAMAESDVHQFIWRAGFSTAAAVTSVSGRGVGMDVVKTNIEKIGGTIELRSVEGQGTTFTIKIPLTLAIVAALVVQAGAERFAIPQISVVELVRAGGASEAAIERINETPVLRLRDRLLPLVDLRNLLGLPSETDQASGDFIIVCKVGVQTFGLIVDRVFDTEEIVVKPVAPILRHITLFSGNTILGDGSVIMILDPNGIARAVGIGTGTGAEREALNGTTSESVVETDKTALLLFRAGGSEPKAVPLGLVARLEEYPIEAIENANGSPVMQYRGKLMPLVPIDGGMVGSPGAENGGRTRQPVLVFNDAERSMGLLVDEILDVVEDRLRVELNTHRPGFLGTATIAGRATEVIDITYWLRLAYPDWFARKESEVGQGQKRVLVLDDSAFFRQLLPPVLTTANYAVTVVDSAAAALKLREAGEMFDAIVSDIEMPEMDGIAFAAEVRRAGSWSSLPLIALTSRVSEADIARGRAAGFSDYVAKFDRDAVLAALAQVLSATEMETL